ncbi:reverse transcriptase [Gossypium australe]|uniref:Reverse transcriptase n=1 Tax=Gossypium australe TaxID=47621 RepID=A0A5B6WPQ1_9ROSI|nr:reverse transcriptase [Gossypium australe]
METVRRKLGFSCGIEVDADGSKGGLSLGWNGNSLISLRSYSPFHIDADVNDCDNGVKWRLTGFYGNPIERLRSMSWDLLRHLHNSNYGPWLVLGDFNEITSSYEKRGGRFRSENQMSKFRDALEDCGLIDLGYRGRWYTWERGRFQETNIHERLDRGVANDTLDTIHDRENYRGHRFLFEASWCLDQSFDEVVKQAWAGCNNNAVDKLAKAGQFFRFWSRTRSREKKRQRVMMEERLSYLYEKNPTDKNLEEIMEVQLDLNLEADKEEIFWKQRARVNWLKHGDKNTSFFHHSTISRHKRVYRLLDLVEKRITMDMNNDLLIPFSEEEIWQVVKSMAPIKAPGHCIDEAQGAFIAGRQISDNTLIAYEILHSLKTRKKCKQGNFALKLDMSKAYDRVECDFLAGMLTSLGFCQEWIILIMRCVCSVSYTVGINEGLSTLLNEAKKKKLMIGAPIGRERFSINHLLFADDCMLFGDASENGAYTVRSILEEYENASGQQVNFEKSLIYFGANVDQQVREQVTNILGVRVATNPEKYLGLPMMVGRRKRWAFANFIDRFRKRIDSWNFHFLSMGGKEVFVKAILQAIPIYVMQCFELPKSICGARELIADGLLWRIVNQLIEESSFTWKDDVIRKLVDLDQARRILSIPLAAPEDADHLLWSCKVLRRLWKLLDLYADLEGSTSDGKNQLRYVHELKTSCMPVYTPVSTKAVFWRPPPVDIIKLNFDASFDKVSKSAITVVVARNDKGLVMGACVYQYTEVADAFVAEARACERAVLFAIDMGFRKIILEGDSLTVIKKLRSAKNDRSVIHSIIQNICTMATFIEEVSYSFSLRSGNQAAHTLAVEGYRWPLPCCWIEEVPDRVNSIVVEDWEVWTRAQD